MRGQWPQDASGAIVRSSVRSRAQGDGDHDGIRTDSLIFVTTVKNRGAPRGRRTLPHERGGGDEEDGFVASGRYQEGSLRFELRSVRGRQDGVKSS